MGRLFLRVCEFFCVRKKIWQWWLVDFGGVEPPKSMHFHRRDADENAWGKNKVFSPTPLCAFERVLCGFAASGRFAPVPSATKKLFLKKKFFGFSKRLFSLRALGKIMQIYFASSSQTLFENSTGFSIGIPSISSA